MYSFRDVLNSMPKEKAREDALWVKLWPRRCAYPVSWLCMKIGISANTISMIAILDVLAACILMCVNNRSCEIIGLILLNLFILFDCVDGTIARTKKKNSYMGEFFDALGGYTICAFALLAISICAINADKCRLLIAKSQYLIAIGSLGSICDIFARLIYQKFTANTLIANAKIGRPLERENDVMYSTQRTLNFAYVRLKIDREFGTGGFFLPIVFIGYFLSILDIICILYSAYHVLSFLAVMLLFSKKALDFDKNT